LIYSLKQPSAFFIPQPPVLHGLGEGGSTILVSSTLRFVLDGPASDRPFPPEACKSALKSTIYNSFLSVKIREIRVNKSFKKSSKKLLTPPCGSGILMAHTVTTEQKNRKQYEN
jgi:hypothetical protein